MKFRSEVSLRISHAARGINATPIAPIYGNDSIIKQDSNAGSANCSAVIALPVGEACDALLRICDVGTLHTVQFRGALHETRASPFGLPASFVLYARPMTSPRSEFDVA